VSQNAAGDLLGHVLDTGRSIRDPSVRGYQTRVRLPYHTDGSDIVGLLCFGPARSGGQSSIVSSTAVYNEILRRRPELVDLLYQPFYFDRLLSRPVSDSVNDMRQLLLRVPDDVHRRLTARAARAGQSVNAVANEILDAAVDADQGDRRTRLRARAGMLGLRQSGAEPVVVAGRRRRRITESTRGTGPVLDRLLAEERERV